MSDDKKLKCMRCNILHYTEPLLQCKHCGGELQDVTLEEEKLGTCRVRSREDLGRGSF